MSARDLTNEALGALLDDIEVRLDIQRTMSENTMAVLEAETGIDLMTLQHIEAGAIDARPRTRVSAAMAKKVRDRRAIWHLARERMLDYEVQPLADKYGVHVNTVWKHIKHVRCQRNAKARRQVEGRIAA